MEQYITIKKKAEAVIDIDKSTFIGISMPLSDEQAVANCLAEAKEKYPDATHYVYAYTCGMKYETQKWNDDGEPSGTGGMPMLEMIKHKKLKNLLIIVVRYYGGIKLGTGGLKRAYSKAAQKAIEASNIITLTHCYCINIRCPYTHWGKMQYELEKQKTLIDEIRYEEDVMIAVAVPVAEADIFMEWVIGCTHSQALLEITGKAYRNILG